MLQQDSSIYGLKQPKIIFYGQARSKKIVRA